MPAFQGPFGPLVEPGWPSTLPGSPDIAGALQTAIQLKMNMDSRQQKLENELAHYALNEKVAAWRHEKDMAAGQFAYDKLDVQRQRDLAIGERDKLNYDLRAKRDNDRIMGQQGLARIRNDAHDKGLKEGTQEFRNYVDAHVNEIEGLIPSSELRQTLKPIYQDENANIKAIRTALFQDKANLSNDIANEVWANKKLTETWPVDHPDWVEDEKVDTDFWGNGGKLTGRKKITTWNEATGAEQYNYIDATRLQELHRRRLELIDNEKKLPKFRNEPSVGVFEDEKKQLEFNTTIQNAKEAQAAAWQKGQDITPQLKERLHSMGYDPDLLDQ